MPFYNIVSKHYNTILSIAPKCGCTTVKGWIKDQIGDDTIESCMIPDKSLADEKFTDYKKVLIIRNPYQRLISYYSLFVIDLRAGEDYIHIDKQRNISLSGKSFSEFIYLMKDLMPDVYQHHLVPQSAGIDIQTFDQIISIGEFDDYLSQQNYPPAKIKNKLNRHNYKKSIVKLRASEMDRTKIPATINFMDDELLTITRRYIYPEDYATLQKYFTP